MAERTTLGGEWSTAPPVRTRMRPLVWADGLASIGEAARLLDGHDHSYLLVRLPSGLGIATDHDFRASLADATLSRASPLSAICSVPAVTVNEHTDSPAALLQMVERGIHHLVVSTDTGEPVGVVRVVDLASAEVRDPLLIRHAISGARDLDDLRDAASALDQTVLEMADTGTPALRVTGMLSTVRDLLVRRVVELTPTLEPPTHVSWLVLGSSARREALPHSDVDTALAWSPPLATSAEQLRADADAVLTGLERCGLSRCPDGANATEPLFSRSAENWVAATRRWTHHPESQSALLLASIVCDNRALTQVEVGRTLMQAMLDSARDRDFLDTLLRFTLDVRPPRGLLRDFAVEHAGARGGLDLKRGGLWPVVLLGRWMSLAVGDPSGSTVDRIRRGSQAGFLTVGEAEDLVRAFEQLFQLRFDQELAALRTGGVADSRLLPGSLDPLQRRYAHDGLHAVSRIQTAVRKAWASGPTRP